MAKKHLTFATASTATFSGYVHKKQALVQQQQHKASNVSTHTCGVGR